MEKNKLTNVGDLSEELLTEVLARLPIKTLLVCKSVSKPWLSHISNPNFINSHLRYIINNNNNDNNPTLLDILDSPEVNLFLDTYSTCHICIDRVVMPSVFRHSRVVGTSCCNGIVCLSNDYRNVVYLWNPSIRGFKEVFVPELYVSKWCPVKTGFAYDSTCNDYKVFRILYEVNLDSVTSKMQVYLVNGDSWREFRVPFWGKTMREKFEGNDFIVVNERLYFNSWDEEQLIAFDLRKEVFGLVPFPGSVQNKWSDVLDFKGSIAVVFESVSGIDLWTLDDDVSGQVSSWTKMFSIVPGPMFNMWLSCYLGAGQFYGNNLLEGNLFAHNILYDSEKKESKYYRDGREYILATLKYTKTLVSLDGFHQVEENADE
ncbi:F-box/kelch-repeat protein At3g23880-like [Apium graveolens]|uniref:F-box/kelch-repeat protein At3g23880-like n=1 Tax=Apium graveolens TaxID=4045 RepID=UPI003D7B3137